MNGLPLHPKLVHLPIALAVLMPLLTSGVLLAWWRGWLQKRTWFVVLACQALLFGSGFLAMQSGEGDADRVERVVGEAVVEEHEEAADAFQVGAGVVFGLCLLPLLLRRQGMAQAAALGATVGSLAVLWLGVRVGEAGGALVYRHGAAAVFVQDAPGGGGAAVPQKRGDGDDDDR